MKRITVILLLASILSVPALFAEVPENAFPMFLFMLAGRHETINSLPMPDVETRTAPGFEDEAVYLVRFPMYENAKTFIEALKEEGIPYGYMGSEEDFTIVLFYSDMIVFIMKAAIGL